LRGDRNVLQIPAIPFDFEIHRELHSDLRSDGAEGRNWAERLPVKFEWLAAA
jgi:hypothetical protein